MNAYLQEAAQPLLQIPWQAVQTQEMMLVSLYQYIQPGRGFVMAENNLEKSEIIYEQGIWKNIWLYIRLIAPMPLIA